MRFKELPFDIQQKVLNEYREGYELHSEWWSHVYDDFERMAEILGFSLKYKSKTERAVYFHGFSSQGDGASFEGKYKFSYAASSKIRSETDDDDLWKIADELAVIQMKMRLHDFGFDQVEISTRSSTSCHSGNMTVDILWDINWDDLRYEKMTDEICDEMTEISRRLADWLYKQLQAEHDYQYSDECIINYVNDPDHDYTEAGELIVE